MWVKADKLSSDILYRLNPEFNEIWASRESSKYKWMLDNRPFVITSVYRPRKKVWDLNPKLRGDNLKNFYNYSLGIVDFSGYISEDDIQYFQMSVQPMSNEEHNAYVVLFDRMPPQ
ncbi:hypothetical protein [Providencia phage PSTCR6]|nr:hypothetical protein [Providencia phage PSTCR6]